MCDGVTDGYILQSSVLMRVLMVHMRERVIQSWAGPLAPEPETESETETKPESEPNASEHVNDNNGATVPCYAPRQRGGNRQWRS